jgi:hypothetical protein
VAVLDFSNNYFLSCFLLAVAKILGELCTLDSHPSVIVGELKFEFVDCLNQVSNGMQGASNY